MRLHNPYAPRHRLGNLGNPPAQNGGAERSPPPPPSSSPAPAPAPAPTPAPAGDGGGSSISYASIPAESRFLPRADIGYSADRGPRVFKRAVIRAPEYLRASEVAPGSSALENLAVEGRAPLAFDAHIPAYLSAAERTPAPASALTRRRRRGLTGLGTLGNGGEYGDPEAIADGQAAMQCCKTIWGMAGLANGGGVDYEAQQRQREAQARAQARASCWGLRGLGGLGNGGNDPYGFAARDAATAEANRLLRMKWYALNSCFTNDNPPPGSYAEQIDSAGNRVQRRISNGELLFGIDPDTRQLMPYRVALDKGYIGAVNPSYGYPQDTGFHLSDALQFAAIAAPVVLSIAAPAALAAEAGAASASLVEETAPVAETVSASAPDYLTELELAPVPEAVITPEVPPALDFPPVSEDVVTPTTPASVPELPTQTPGLQDTIKKALQRLLAPAPHRPAPAAPASRPAVPSAPGEAESGSGFALALGAGIVFAVLKGLS